METSRLIGNTKRVNESTVAYIVRLVVGYLDLDLNLHGCTYKQRARAPDDGDSTEPRTPVIGTFLYRTRVVARSIRRLTPFHDQSGCLNVKTYQPEFIVGSMGSVKPGVCLCLRDSEYS